MCTTPPSPHFGVKFRLRLLKSGHFPTAPRISCTHPAPPWLGEGNRQTSTLENETNPHWLANRPLRTGDVGPRAHPIVRGTQGGPQRALTAVGLCTYATGWDTDPDAESAITHTQMREKLVTHKLHKLRYSIRKPNHTTSPKNTNRTA